MSLKKMYRYVRKAYEAWQVIALQLGWRQSFIDGRPVDGDGNPVPWYTYPAIEFIKTLNFENSRIFEYGCGNSSMYWAARAKEVHAVENNANWAQTVREFKIPRLTLLELAERDDYISAPHRAGGKFDVIIVDGRYRRECARVAVEVISERGIIIFDNADWYPDACEALRNLGWFQIDFSGLGPIAPFRWTTSIFMRAMVDLKRDSSYRLLDGSVPVWQHDD
jgi:hypothetical protein